MVMTYKNRERPILTEIHGTAQQHAHQCILNAYLIVTEEKERAREGRREGGNVKGRKGEKDSEEEEKGNKNKKRKEGGKGR